MRHLADPQAGKRYCPEKYHGRASKERELLHVLTEAAYTGRPDFDLLERVLRAVFEPGTIRIRRAIGHPAAPVTTEAMISIMKAWLAASPRIPPGV